ncbi:MAG: orotidine-5'-phosphate decarboxylase [Planctomycetales bacterium]|nr:orotidine-5'-phosphate decarboxylase [Planctomycetales bacterium]
MAFHFTDALAAAVVSKGNPVCVGIDPRWEQLPAPLTNGLNPLDPADKAKAYLHFSCDVIDAVAKLAPVVKPQVAFFEELGPHGMVALGKVIAHARSQGVLVLLDGKRNDIGSTAVAYARGILGETSVWKADALTISPYLGADSLEPFADTAKATGAGLFVLVKTSNPGGGMLQDLIADGKRVYEHVAQLVETMSADTKGSSGYGLVGAVTGATYPTQLAELRAKMPSSWLLIPGFGSQGGTAADVAGGFDNRGLGAVVNNSRGIIFAHSREPYREEFGAPKWQRAVEAATEAMIGQLNDVLPTPTLN